MYVCLTTSSLAQSSTHHYGNDHNCADHGPVVVTATDPNNPSGDVNFCFDVDYVMENCVPVYVKIVVHFFADDNCDGPISIGTPGSQPDTYSIDEAYDIAENLVDEANDFYDAIGRNHEWYPEALMVDPTDHSPEQCVPIRFVLDDVLIHCDTDAQSGTARGSALTLPGIYAVDGAYNYFLIQTTRNSGAASGIGRGSNASVGGSLATSLLIHEAGHSFGLPHTFLDDGCSDTGSPDVEWDDCNDNLSFPRTIRSCWTVLSDDHPDCLCPDPSPCCGWSHQTNNVMSYSSFGDWPGQYRDDGTWQNGANMTECQIRKMLEEISRNQCDIVIGPVGQDCPPASANASVFEASTSEDCSQFCIDLSASDNDSFFDFIITDAVGDEVVNTGFVSRSIYDYCIAATTDKIGDSVWAQGLSAGEAYTLTVTVYNACGDASTETVDFVLPTPCPIIISSDDVFELKMLSLAPNPATESVTIEVEVSEDAVIDVYASSLQYGTTYGRVSTIQAACDASNIVTIDISTWQPGVNSIVLHSGATTVVQQIIKQ